ncbi:MAG: ABC transporter ATP-binding protein [Anaerotruncus sp.]|nr:ABC transporter ATP-binding protein [Anaerotruncus sp.]
MMWFDTIDPRDPLQLTDGVYALLLRYYTRGNANFWAWAMLRQRRSPRLRPGPARQAHPRVRRPRPGPLLQGRARRDLPSPQGRGRRPRPRHGPGLAAPRPARARGPLRPRRQVGPRRRLLARGHPRPPADPAPAPALSARPQRRPRLHLRPGQRADGPGRALQARIERPGPRPRHAPELFRPPPPLSPRPPRRARRDLLLRLEEPRRLPLPDLETDLQRPLVQRQPLLEPRGAPDLPGTARHRPPSRGRASSSSSAITSKDRQRGPMTNEPLIVTKDLKKIYTMGPHRLEALAGITLSFDRGEFAGLVGPSGSGKTTLLNILGSLDTPSEGSAVVMGRAIETLTHKEAARLRNRHIGFIFQTFNLLPVYTVYENVEFALLLARRPARRPPPQGHGRARLGPPGRPGQVQAGPALRRPVAARGHRPGRRQGARHRPRRRADGQPRRRELAQRPPDDGAPQPRPRHDLRLRHPRSQGHAVPRAARSRSSTAASPPTRRDRRRPERP